MDTNAPDDRLSNDAAEPVVPDPHRGEAAPPRQEGMRPEADTSLVRPEEDEPGGPLAGLVGASSAKVVEEATPGGDAATEALLAQMGVEEEGVESGQLLGFVVATLLAVGALAIVLIYLIYTPFRGETQARAENVGRSPELAQSRVDAAAKLDRATRTGESYTVPIDRAMGLVAAEYGGTAAAASGVPATRQRFNTLPVVGMATQAVQAPSALAPGDAPTTPAAGLQSPRVPNGQPRGGTTDVEVGVDDTMDNPEQPEPQPYTE